MDYKIQSTVKKTGLSISSYVRCKNKKLLEQAIKDVKANKVDALSLVDFYYQIDSL